MLAEKHIENDVDGLLDGVSVSITQGSDLLFVYSRSDFLS